MNESSPSIEEPIRNISPIIASAAYAEIFWIHRILKDIEKYPIKVRVLPGVAELALGKVSVSELKEVEIEDLLGREVALPNQTLLEENIKNKVVMVTGAGGSIGSELCRQIIKHQPSSLILFEVSCLYLVLQHELTLPSFFPQLEYL